MKYYYWEKIPNSNLLEQKWGSRKKEDKMIGSVYYNPKSNKFLQIRERSIHGFKCSHDAEYFSDAKTTIMTQHISMNDVLDLVLVEDIEHFWGAYYNGCGWLVNRGEKEKEYFFGWGEIKKESETYQVEEECDNCGIYNVLTIPMGESVEHYTARGDVICDNCGCGMRT